MENPRFERAARRRRLAAFTLAVLLHVLLLAGLAWLGAGGASELFDAAGPATVEVAPQP